MPLPPIGFRPVTQEAKCGLTVNRTVREYTEQHYLPAAAAYAKRAADKGAIGRQMLNWRHGLEEKWSTLRFGEVNVQTKD